MLDPRQDLGWSHVVIAIMAWRPTGLIQEKASERV